jgi:hypothetical protein
MFLEFAGRPDLWEGCWRGLQACGSDQEAHQVAEDPARRFIELINSALVSKRAHVGNLSFPDRAPACPGEHGWTLRNVGASEDWEPKGPCIGWADDDIFYLDPGAAYSVASRHANEQGQALGVGARTLWKRLAEAGLLQQRDRDRNTYKVQIGERLRNTIAVAVYRSEEPGKTGNAGNDPKNPRESAASFPDSASRFADQTGETGNEIGKEPQGNGAFQNAVPDFPAFPDSSGRETPIGAGADPAPAEPWRDDPAEQHNWTDEE